MDLSIKQRLISGALAGICSIASTYPLDLVRTRLSMAGPSSSGIIQTIQLVYREEGGVYGLFRGITPTILVH